MSITSLSGIFIACLFIQLFYYLFYFSRLAFRKDQKKTPSIHVQGVSIIVCARNEVANLRKLLPSLYEQQYENYEIIVVDDKSEDETMPFLLAEKEKHKQLRTITIEHTPPHINSKKYGLALAIKSAKHNTLLFTDADCIPASTSWIATMTSPFNNSATKIVLGFSQYLPTKGLLNLFIRFETFYTGIQYMSLALAGSPYMGVGRNLAYSKSYFLEKKGFGAHQKVTGGDDDLFVNSNATKHNTQIVTGEKSMIYSVPKKTWKDFFAQKKRHLSVGKLYKFKDKLRLGVLFLSQLLYWVALIVLLVQWQEPYLAIGGFVLRTGVQYLVFFKAGQKLGARISLWMLPVLDVLYVMYYIATGISATAAREIKWN